VLVRSIRGELDYKVSLVPPPGAAAKPAVYDITLRRFHRGWLVDSWAPSYRGLYGPGKLSDASLPIVAPTNPHLRAVWAYAPIGFVALAVLLAPLVLAGRSLLERRRVARTL